MNLFREKIENFVPFNEQEIEDKEYFLEFIDMYEDIFSRDNKFGHITVSGFVVNKERTKMLVVWHKLNNGWIFPGGHIDGDNDLLGVAVREVEEETGLKVKVLDKEIFGIFAGPVEAHRKRGKFVHAHIHFDVIFLLEADDTMPLVYKEDENSAVKWLNFEDAEDSSVFPPVRPINKKLIEKLNKLI